MGSGLMMVDRRLVVVEIQWFCSHYLPEVSFNFSGFSAIFEDEALAISPIVVSCHVVLRTIQTAYLRLL